MQITLATWPNVRPVGRVANPHRVGDLGGEAFAQPLARPAPVARTLVEQPPPVPARDAPRLAQRPVRGEFGREASLRDRRRVDDARVRDRRQGFGEPVLEEVEVAEPPVEPRGDDPVRVVEAEPQAHVHDALDVPGPDAHGDAELVGVAPVERQRAAGEPCADTLGSRFEAVGEERGVAEDDDAADAESAVPVGALIGGLELQQRGVEEAYLQRLAHATSHFVIRSSRLRRLVLYMRTCGVERDRASLNGWAKPQLSLQMARTSSFLAL